MLVKCALVWIIMSVISTSATNTTRQSQIRDDPRIYVHGGRPVRQGEFPFLVLLEIITDEEKRGICSGSIASPTTVLTSAHCDIGDITAYAGTLSNNETDLWKYEVQKRKVESVAKPIYPTVYDVMICYIDKPWEWTEFVAPVALHLRPISLQPSFVISCQVMGFGKTTPDSEGGTAHVMDQLIGSSAQCFDVHPFMWFYSFWMCTMNVRNKTVCQGDSGGPAVCNGQQWGVNMGMAPAEDLECIPPKTANVYVATAFFRSWILNSIKDLPSCAHSIHRYLLKISLYEVLQYLPLCLLLSTAVELLYFH